MSLLTILTSLVARTQKPATSSLQPTAQILTYETRSFPETLARIAESQVGHHEQGGNNLGPDVVEYQKATWLTPGPWAWCAAFVCWCQWHAITTLGMAPRWPRARTPGAYDLEQWAQGKYGDMLNSWRIFASDPRKPETWPRRGDIITFTWSHTGIVTGYDPATKKISTVEGNAGMSQVSDSAQGDGVVSGIRHITKCRRLIRYVG